MNRTRLLIGFLLSAVLLYFFLKNIDLGEVWKTIRSGNPYWLLLAASVNLFNYLIRALRWRYFFLPIKKTRLWNLFSTTVIGFAVTTLFPARLGEVVRPYLLGSKENISKSAAIATVVVERLFDTLSILFLLVIYLLVLIKPEQLSPEARVLLSDLKKAGLLLFMAVVAGIILLYYLKTRPALLKKLIGFLERILPARIGHSLENVIASFMEGLSILHDPKILLTISCWSVFFWVAICFGFWCGVRAFVQQFAFTNTFLIMILLAIGIAVPTPGGVGSYHLACKIGLSRFFGIPETLAGAIALVSHFMSFIPVTILGLLFIWHEGLTTTRLTRMATKEVASEK